MKSTKMKGSKISKITAPSHPILLEAFEDVVKHFCQPEGLKSSNNWMKRVLNENVKGGKCVRGMLFITTYQEMKRNITVQHLKKAAPLFWILEIIHTIGLILDDISDKSITRRGRPCWYNQQDVGMKAFNDVISCNHGVFYALRVSFQAEKRYDEIETLLRRVNTTTLKGQCLDMLSERNHCSDESVYKDIVDAKTGEYTFVCPIHAALLLADVDDESLFAVTKKLGLEFGEFFQIQDDFLDCYGKSEVIGKVGTDIVDGKCSWLFVEAMKIASEEQKIILKENFARGSPGSNFEKKVKKIYDSLDLRKQYLTFEQSREKYLAEQLEKLKLPFSSFQLILNLLKSRQT